MLYLAIPTYNEVATIGVLLWRIRTVLTEFPREYEVVVYDDASTDETATVAEQYENVMPVRVIRGKDHLGYSGATDALLRYVASATKYPKRDAVLLMQGDFTDPPAMLPEFARHFEGGADLVAGDRSVVADAPLSVRRLFRIAHWAIRPFVRVEGVTDLTASMRLVRITVLRDALRAAGNGPLMTGDGWNANAELMMRLAPWARRVESVPVEPTYGVRQRDSRRMAWKDAVALLRWAWKTRGQRVLVGSATRGGDHTRHDRHDRVERPERADRQERPRKKPERADRQERKERQTRSDRRDRGSRKERSERSEHKTADNAPSESRQHDSEAATLERLRQKIRTREGTKGLDEAPAPTPKRDFRPVAERFEPTPPAEDLLANLDPFADPFASPAQRLEAPVPAQDAPKHQPSASPKVWTPPEAARVRKPSPPATPAPVLPAAEADAFDVDPFANPAAAKNSAVSDRPLQAPTEPTWTTRIDPFADPFAAPKSEPERVAPIDPFADPFAAQRSAPERIQPVDPFADPFASPSGASRGQLSSRSLGAPLAGASATPDLTSPKESEDDADDADDDDSKAEADASYAGSSIDAGDDPDEEMDDDSDSAETDDDDKNADAAELAERRRNRRRRKRRKRSSRQRDADSAQAGGSESSLNGPFEAEHNSDYGAQDGDSNEGADLTTNELDEISEEIQESFEPRPRRRGRRGRRGGAKRSRQRNDDSPAE